MFYLKAARNRSERVRAHTLPLDCLIASFQAVVMRLHWTSAFTLSAASIIGLWFYFECVSVKSRTEEKYKHCASPSPPAFAYTLPCRAVYKSTERLCSVSHPDLSAHLARLHAVQRVSLKSGEAAFSFYAPRCWKSFPEHTR